MYSTTNTAVAASLTVTPSSHSLRRHHLIQSRPHPLNLLTAISQPSVPLITPPYPSVPHYKLQLDSKFEQLDTAGAGVVGGTLLHKVTQ